MTIYLILFWALGYFLSTYLAFNRLRVEAQDKDQHPAWVLGMIVRFCIIAIITWPLNFYTYMRYKEVYDTYA